MAIEPQESEKPVTDPVCGMSVAPYSNRASAVHDGVTYYFCSTSCHQRFLADPKRNIAAQSVSICCLHDQVNVSTSAPPFVSGNLTGTVYTCLHPEVRQNALQPGEDGVRPDGMSAPT